MKVERRLRNAVAKSLKRNEQFALFVDEAEFILTFFAMNKKLPPLNGVSMQLDEFLRGPIRSERMRDMGKHEEILSIHRTD